MVGILQPNNKDKIIADNHIRILELEQQLKECQGMLAVYFGDERVYNCIKCDSLFAFDGPPSSDLPLCTSCAELEECQMEIEEARILGRAEAMEWMDILVKRWKNDAKRYKENYPEHSYFYEECADVLDTHIEDYFRTK